jgi:Trp operon repressor
VRVNSTEELQRIRSHPDFHGGFVVLSDNFSVGDGEEFLQSLECIDEQESFGDRIRILHVLPASQPADQTGQAPSS